MNIQTQQQILEKWPYSAPAKDCGEYLGIKIWDDWGLGDYAEIQKLIYADEERFTGETDTIRSVADHLPDYGYRGRARFDYVMGCVSQFNLDDIRYFIEHEWQNRPKAVEVRATRIRNQLVDKLSWVPSAATLDKIELVLSGQRELLF